MHVRRIAPQLSDVFARHGLAAQPDAAVTGRTRTTYHVPLTVATASGPVLVDGDLESAEVDEGAVLRLYLTAVDCGARAMFLHAGAIPASAAQYADRLTPWSRAEAATFLGETLWAAALGEPLPPLPAPLAAPLAPVPASAPTATDPLPLPEPDAASELPAEPDPAPTIATDATKVPALDEPAEELATLAVDDGPVAVPAFAPTAPTAASGPARDSFIDLDDGRATEPAMDLETGADVHVTTLPTDAADELSAAEPLRMPAPAPAPAVPPQPEPAAGEGSPEPPLFQLPPAFRPEPPGASPLPVPDGSRGLLPARVVLAEAREAVAGRLFGIDEWELILQPVHLFDYAVEVLRSGSLQADVQRGRLQVHGTDRRVTPIDPATTDPPARVHATPELTVMDKVLRVSPERAQQLAQEWAAATFGKTVHVNLAGVDDSFDLLERRTVGPTSSQVKLAYLGVWHRPFWRLWGDNGHVDLDAVEGNVLEEELRTPDPDYLVVE